MLINKGRSACIMHFNYWIAATKAGSVQECFVDQRTLSAARSYRLCSVLLCVERRIEFELELCPGA